MDGLTIQFLLTLDSVLTLLTAPRSRELFRVALLNLSLVVEKDRRPVGLR